MASNRTMDWLEDVQERFRTDRAMFLSEDLDVPEDAHLQLLSLTTPQLCMMILKAECNVLTKMRIQAQLNKRRMQVVAMPGELYISCLHAIDRKYDLDNMVSLTPAQLLGVAMRKDATDQHRERALWSLQTLLANRKKSAAFASNLPRLKPDRPPKKNLNGLPMKRSHSPTLEEAMMRAKEAKRSQSPDHLRDPPILPPRPIAPSPDSQVPSLTDARSTSHTAAPAGLMQWVNAQRLAQAIWDPRLYYRQMDLAEALALEKNVRRPDDLPGFTPDELKALKYSPNRQKLPDMPIQRPSQCPPTQEGDEEIFGYLYRGREPENADAELTWLLDHSDLRPYILAMRKVIRLKAAGRLTWDRLEKEVETRPKRGGNADPMEQHARLVRELQDGVELSDFFCPDGKMMDYPLTPALRKRIGDGPFWRLKEMSKSWSRYDH